MKASDTVSGHPAEPSAAARPADPALPSGEPGAATAPLGRDRGMAGRPADALPPRKPPPVLQEMLIGARHPAGGGRHDPTVVPLPIAGSAEHRAEHRAEHPADPAAWVSPQDVWPAVVPGLSIALLDPAGRQSAALVGALKLLGADEPQRLALRERASLAPLATLLRTEWRRPPAQTAWHVLAIQAPVSDPGALDVAHALAGAASQVFVLIDQLPEPDVTRLLRSLKLAMLNHSWRCGRLLLVVPTARHSAAAQVRSMAWPSHSVVQVLRWDLPRSAWEAADAAAAHRAWAPLVAATHRSAAEAAGTPPSANDSRPMPLAAWSAETAAPLPAPTPASDLDPGLPPAPRGPVLGDEERSRLQRLLTQMQSADGMMLCAVIDLATGRVLLQAAPGPSAIGESAPARRMPTAAMLAESLCSARRAHLQLAADQGVPDEVLITAAGRHALLRQLPGSAPRGFLALLDRSRANLALLRFRLIDAGRLLVG